MFARCLNKALDWISLQKQTDSKALPFSELGELYTVYIICNGDIMQQLSINHGTISTQVKDYCFLEQNASRGKIQILAANSLPLVHFYVPLLKLPTG